MGIALLGVQAGFSQEMSIAATVDTSAFPILVHSQIARGTAPYTAEISVQTPLLGTIRKQVETWSSEFVVALPTNLNQTVSIQVRSADGVVAVAELEVSIPILQFEGFLLDEDRYQDAHLISDALGEEVAKRADSVRAEDHFLLPAPFAFNSGKKPIAVDWPARYLVEYEGGASLIVTVKASAETRLPIRGICDDYAGRALGYTHLEEQFRRMSGTGVNAIQFIKLMTMDSETDTRIHDPNPIPNRDEALGAGMRAAKAAGFHVMLRLVLFLDAPWPRADNLQDRLEPDDWEAWFEAYRIVVLRYAELCEEVQADIYAFSDTLQTTYQFEEKYRELIEQIRAVYSGKLTVLTGPYDDRLGAIGFWDALDYIGIDGSLHTGGYASFEEANELSLDDIYHIFVEEFERNVLPTVEAVGKPLLWGEIYYRSVERSTYGASGIPVSDFIAAHDDDDAIGYEPEMDFEQQALGYSAMLRLMQAYSGTILGSFALQWTLEDPLIQWCCSGGSHQIPFTAAQDVFRLWWTDEPGAHSEALELGAMFDGIEYAEFSKTAYRGFWDLDSFGRSSATFEEIIQGASNGAMDVVTFEFSNPAYDFLRLRYTMNPNQSDYADWDGVVVAIAAADMSSVKIEIAFSEWMPAYSAPQAVGPIPRILRLPFAAFDVKPDEDAPTTVTAVDQSNINGMAIWPTSRGGKLTVYAVGVYREE